MTNFEMVETLRQHANVSYEEAKQALEETNWDILEAMVLLEKEGKVETENGGAYTTQTEPPKEKKAKKESAFRSNMGRLGTGIAKLIKIGNTNFFQVSRKNEMLFEVPVTVLAFLLIFSTRWLTLILLAIGLFTGFRYCFRGPDLGKTVINSAMDKASEFAENVGKKEDKAEDKTED